MTERDAAEGKGVGQAPSAFKVTDRRHFTAEGERRSGEPEQGEEPRTGAGSEDAASKEARPSFEHRPLEEPPDVSFTMLVNAMAQPALLFLGEIPHPGTGQPTVDAEKAKLQIDLLELIRVKTRGNLSQQEESLLEQVLYHLRMLYVARAGHGG